VLTRVAAHEAIIGDMHQRNTDLQHELAQLRDDFAKLKIEAERLDGVDAVLGAVVGELEAAKAANEALEQTLKAVRAARARTKSGSRTRSPISKPRCDTPAEKRANKPIGWRSRAPTIPCCKARSRRSAKITRVCATRPPTAWRRRRRSMRAISRRCGGKSPTSPRA